MASSSEDSKSSIIASEKALMPPPSGLPLYRSDYIRNKKVVLEEEEFTNALELIIERDFFPETSKLRECNQLDDTGSTISDSIKANREISLDKFVGRYTSEDSKTIFYNANHPDSRLYLTIHCNMCLSDQSFEELHAKDLLERRKKLPWLYEPEDPSEKTVSDTKPFPFPNAFPSQHRFRSISKGYVNAVLYGWSPAYLSGETGVRSIDARRRLD